MTLRHRLECKIKTAETVSTADDICPLSPSEKPSQFTSLFTVPNKAPWKRENETHKEMLVC